MESQYTFTHKSIDSQIYLCYKSVSHLAIAHLKDNLKLLPIVNVNS